MLRQRSGLRLRAGGLAEEVVLVRRRQRGVRVGPADHAELERVDAELRLELAGRSSAPSGRTRTGASPASSARCRSRLPLSQRSKSANSSLGDRNGMRLAVALDLRRPRRAAPTAPASRRTRWSNGLPVKASMSGNMHAVAEVAVVRDGQHLAAGLLLVGGHPLPQVARVVAAERLQRGEGLDLAGLRAVVAEDDVAVEVVAAGVRGPLVADERGEAPGSFAVLGRLDGLVARRSR